MELFFPNSTGDRWFYDSVTTPPAGASSNSFDKVVVTGQTSVLGQMASVFQETVIDDPAGPTENYYYKNNGGLAFVGTNVASATVSAALAPYIEALFPVMPGTVASFARNGVDFGVDLDGDGINETANLNLTVNIVDFEALDTAIGSLARTVRSTESLDGTIILSSNHSSVPFTSLVTTWSAPGIGAVKRTLSVTVQGKTQQQSFDIRGYVVEGNAKGLTTPFHVADGVAAPNSDLYTPGSPAVASDGTNFLAIEETPIGLQGNLIDNNGNVGSALNIGAAGAAGMAFDGANYVVAVNSTTLTVHRITPAGVDLDAPNGVSVSSGLTPGLHPAAASGTNNTLISYTKFDSLSSQHLLYGVLVDHNGNVLAPGEFGIAVDNATHLYPKVSFDGNNYLVVWQQQPTSGAAESTCDIYAVRVSPSGTVLDTPAIAVSTATNGQFTPAAAFDGTNYLVVWQDGRNNDPLNGRFDIYGARVTTSGQVLDSAGLAIDSGGTQARSDPSIVFTGSQYLVAWSDLGYAVNGATGIRVAQLTTGGTVPSAAGGLIVSGAPPSATTSQYAFPVLAARAQSIAVVWLNNAETTTSQKSVLGLIGYSF